MEFSNSNKNIINTKSYKKSIENCLLHLHLPLYSYMHVYVYSKTMSKIVPL